MLKNRQITFRNGVKKVKTQFVDTFVSTKGAFLGVFCRFEFKIHKHFQLLRIGDVKKVTQNTIKSWVTTVFCSFWVTILGSTPYENGSFSVSEALLGDYFDAMSATVTVTYCPARFYSVVKDYDRN